jgi:hypothetical protein
MSGNTYFVMAGPTGNHPGLSMYVGRNLSYAADLAMWWQTIMPEDWHIWIESIDSKGIPHAD